MPNKERPLLGVQQKIDLGKIDRSAIARLMCFLICIGVLTAAFAVSGVWKDGRQWFGNHGVQLESEDATSWEEDASPSVPPSSADTNKKEDINEEIPIGAIPVVSLDLSCDWRSQNVLENQTAHRLNLAELLTMPISWQDVGDEPMVLILHTHATEAYMSPDTSYIVGTVGDSIYSDLESRSVVAVGKALCDTLNQNGIPSVHCSQKHGKDGTLQNAYASSEACVKAYLKKYPSIQYVIDLHRDGILDQSGALVRTETQSQEDGYCQVMLVVGSDGNGTECPNWKENLALALQLCARLDGSVEGMCRTVSLRNASYNQELAPHSLLLEIGSAGNTQEEAIRTVRLLGEELSCLIKESISS